MIYTDAMAQPARSQPPVQTLTISLPSSAHIPEALLDADYVRYVLAGTLYLRGVLSGAEARSLTGDSRRAFEEKMARHGFPLMPDDPSSVAEELDAGL